MAIYNINSKYSNEVYENNILLKYSLFYIYYFTYYYCVIKIKYLKYTDYLVN